MEDSIFLDVVGDSPVMRVLQFLIEGRHFDYILTDLAENAGVSWGTLHVIFPKLIKYDVVKKVREIFQMVGARGVALLVDRVEQIL